ncbi:hypothetical protein [Solidesulfovibrio fructosivorans]|uniref:hypothetical protein n=1 Tax=Solidesulfovibrio fructosivorans TaxID=878 RepID=UPI00117C5E3C|nr:hypothetical protein [Solidesulfovibrio fructosivorans]
MAGIENVRPRLGRGFSTDPSSRIATDEATSCRRQPVAKDLFRGLMRIPAGKAQKKFRAAA